jgi:hypothetical protein
LVPPVFVAVVCPTLIVTPLTFAVHCGVGVRRQLAGMPLPAGVAGTVADWI